MRAGQDSGECRQLLTAYRSNSERHATQAKSPTCHCEEVCSDSGMPTRQSRRYLPKPRVNHSCQLSPAISAKTAHSRRCGNPGGSNGGGSINIPGFPVRNGVTMAPADDLPGGGRRNVPHPRPATIPPGLLRRRFAALHCLLAMTGGASGLPCKIAAGDSWELAMTDPGAARCSLGHVEFFTPYAKGHEVAQTA